MSEKPTYEQLEQRVRELEKAESERKQAEKALQESEQKFRSIFENLPMGIHMYQLDPDGQLRFISANPAANEILGVDNTQYLGKTIYEAFPEIHKTEIPGRFKIIAEKGGFWKKEEIVYKDEKIEGAFENFNFQTSPGRMVSLFLETTERKQAEKALRENEERFKYFTEASFEAIFFSEKGVCIEQNPAAEIMFGYTSKEAIGRLGTDWIAPESKDLVMNNMMKGVTEPYEAIAQKKDGSTFPARIHAKEMQYKGRTIRVTSLRDITDFKMLENDLRNREEGFRLIAQSTNDIFYEWIVKTGELRWFGDIDTALGYQKGEIEHTLDAWLKVIHPEDRPSLDDAVKLHTNSTEPINYVYRVIRKTDH